MDLERSAASSATAALGFAIVFGLARTDPLASLLHSQFQLAGRGQGFVELNLRFAGRERETLASVTPATLLSACVTLPTQPPQVIPVTFKSAVCIVIYPSSRQCCWRQDARRPDGPSVRRHTQWHKRPPTIAHPSLRQEPAPRAATSLMELRSDWFLDSSSLTPIQSSPVQTSARTCASFFAALLSGLVLLHFPRRRVERMAFERRFTD